MYAYIIIDEEIDINFSRVAFFYNFAGSKWSRSSMDRIVDSGSIDWSSNLHGITK